MTAPNTCQCGHSKSSHIYEEGACRPGFVCECPKYVSSAPASSIEEKAHEYAALLELKRDHVDVFNDYHLENAYLAGYREGLEMAAEVVEKRAIKLAESAAIAEKAGRTRVAEFRYSESEVLDGVEIAIRSLKGDK